MKCALGLSPKSITPSLRQIMPCVSSWLALDGPHRDDWRGSFREYFRRDRDAGARQFMTQLWSAPLEPDRIRRQF